MKRPIHPIQNEEINKVVGGIPDGYISTFLVDYSVADKVTAFGKEHEELTVLRYDHDGMSQDEFDEMFRLACEGHTVVVVVACPHDWLQGNQFIRKAFKLVEECRIVGIVSEQEDAILLRMVKDPRVSSDEKLFSLKLTK